MTRYAAGQLVLALVVTAVGAVKAFRLVVDHVEEGISNMAGLT